MITLDNDFPTAGLIMVDNEVLGLLRCPACGAQAADRHTSEGPLVYCILGCNGRRLGGKAAEVEAGGKEA